MSEQGGRALAWAAVGCAGILVLGFCIATGAATYLLVGAPTSRSPTATPGAPEKPGVPPASSWVGNPVAPTKPGALWGPVRITAEVTSVTGAAPVAVGDSCTLQVDERPKSGGGTWCQTEVRCGSRTLYGGTDRGYFECVGDGRGLVRGRDDRTTRDDGDPSLLIDTESRTLTIADDANGESGAFGLEARITRVE